VVCCDTFLKKERKKRWKKFGELSEREGTEILNKQAEKPRGTGLRGTGLRGEGALHLTQLQGEAATKVIEVQYTAIML
jgi:hypothetical protein